MPHTDHMQQRPYAIFLCKHQMPEVTAAQARALYQAGITDPEALATTPATEVERALCAWLPHAMRTSGAAKPKDARAAATRIGVTGQLGSNAVVRRSAKLLLTGDSFSP